mgnify:CR=1 FL=1
MEHIRAYIAALNSAMDILAEAASVSAADLAAGRLDAVAGSAPNLAYLAKTRPDAFETVQPPFGEPKYFAWVTRKEGSESLIAAIDAALVKIQDDGRLAAMQQKWFGVTTALPKEMPAM